MNNSEIKQWAKEKLKGNVWTIFPAIFVAGLLTTLTIGSSYHDGHYKQGVSLGWIFYFVSVGLAFFMVKFIKGEKTNFNDIFHFYKDTIKCIGACLLQAIFVFLWALLLIVPGIIKLIAYALVPYLMADEKYNDTKIPELLKLSENMMKGHKMDFFLLNLSFIGWHILAAFTLFLLEIWVAPYQQIAVTKFLTDVKESYEQNNK